MTATMGTMTGVTRRAVMGVGAASAPVALLAACGVGPFTTPGSGPGGVSGPKEVVWSMTGTGGGPREVLWDETFKIMSKATGLQITFQLEPQVGYWDKRQAEHAAGAVSVDIMYNQLDWVLPGGFNGLFVEHGELMRRDKIDPKRYFQIGLTEWA